VQLEWDIDARAVPFNMSNPLVSDHPAARLQREATARGRVVAVNNDRVAPCSTPQRPQLSPLAS
jgi:hypothetical protein